MRRKEKEVVVVGEEWIPKTGNREFDELFGSTVCAPLMTMKPWCSFSYHLRIVRLRFSMDDRFLFASNATHHVHCVIHFIKLVKTKHSKTVEQIMNTYKFTVFFFILSSKLQLFFVFATSRWSWNVFSFVYLLAFFPFLHIYLFCVF